MFLSLDTIPGLKGQVSAPEENVKEKPEFSGAFGIYAVKNMEPSQGKASISRFFFRGYISVTQGPSFPSILMEDAIDGKHSCTR